MSDPAPAEEEPKDIGKSQFFCKYEKLRDHQFVLKIHFESFLAQY